MYAGAQVAERADQPCIVMAGSGEVVTYREFDTRTNRLAHLLRSYGLRAGDHYAILMENHVRYLEACGAGERSGLFYTPINSHLTSDEVAYILQNSEARVVITSRALKDVAIAAMAAAPDVTVGLIVDPTGDDGPLVDYEAATASWPTTPIEDETLGAAMLYSSGTTGRPKGIVRELSGRAPAEPLALAAYSQRQWRYREGMTYLSPAPLYHGAPQGATGLTIRTGGTVVLMEQFDPEDLLRLIEMHAVTHIQMVPTMFSRLLKLPADVRARYDTSSLECVVHAAAPCPIPVKEAMIDWWGPILIEYYGATEGIGSTYCTSEEWLAHKGTVGRATRGELHILDDDHQECPVGTTGTVYFKPPGTLQYWKDPEKAKQNSTPDGTCFTVGDMGYVDDDGFLYLTDRTTFMIVSGGVNIYPQETENLLVTHPKVADVAVFGVPNPDLGEEVKAVVQPMPDVAPTPDLAAELIAFCREHLSKQKCPRSIDFDPALPRLATGKLYKRVLRDRYWSSGGSRIV